MEAGDGVPFFDERFSCRDDGADWSSYRELVEYARLRIFEKDEGQLLARELALSLAARTWNITEVLQCNVGVIAGYHLLARRYVVIGDDWKAYRLLQLALIYVFTLRNALQVPEDAARDWATRTDRIVQEIKILRARLWQEQQRRLTMLPQVSPSTRIQGLRIAVVSICAYPEDHPLVLRSLTPENRKAYAERHGYAVHVHLEHPMPDQGIHIQHSKLELVAQYLRTGDYDWVAWLDCDSILMNFNRTLDSIIYRYARRSARSSVPDDLRNAAGSERKEPSERTPEELPVEEPLMLDLLEAEPLEHEVLEAFVSHVGSCNSDDGCFASTSLRVNPNTHYTVTVRAAQIDMESESEKLSSISIGNIELGECNPMPDSDYDCRMYSCFGNVEVPLEEVASGRVLLQVHAVRTHNDCRCSRLHSVCYSGALAAYEEATEGEKMTDPSYGLFVKFTFTPKAVNASIAADVEFDRTVTEHHDSDGCSCNFPTSKGTCRNSRTGSWLRDYASWTTVATESLDEISRAPPAAVLRRKGAECEGPDILLGISISLPLCLQLCREIPDCVYVAYGIDQKRGQCYWEVSDCLTFEEDSYLVYDVTPTLSYRANFRTPAQSLWGGCSAYCASQEVATILSGTDSELAALDDEGIDLLITEEGWGLSSANWMIRRSNWSIAFLETAFNLCHREMPLFGDQDAMIHLLLNSRALNFDSSGDALDPHAVIIPQRELNAYDALNAYFMGCDGFMDGDLLVTFPGCKDPPACNPIFMLAAGYAKGLVSASHESGPRNPHHVRLFGPVEEAAELLQAAREMIFYR